jgi:hypothetical protein
MSISSVSGTYARDCGSTKSNPMGMRPMQEHASVRIRRSVE